MRRRPWRPWARSAWLSAPTTCPPSFSGGEQQRACIARALINHPEIVLADEPTGNLDEANEQLVLDIFARLHAEGATLIVVTHDAHVASCGQRQILLNHGRLVGERISGSGARGRGTPDILGFPSGGAERHDGADHDGTGRHDRDQEGEDG